MHILHHAPPSRYVIRHRGPKRRNQCLYFPIYPGCPVPYRKFTVSDPCVWNRNQMERDCEPRNFLVVLVTLPIIYHPCNPRTLQNTWCRPLRPASSTLTQPPVTYLPITPIGHWTQPQLSDYANEESVGAGFKQSGLARSPVLFSVRLTALTVRKQVRFLHHHKILCGGRTRIHHNKFGQGALFSCNVDRSLIDFLQAGIEKVELIPRPCPSGRPHLYLEGFRTSSEGWTYHVPEFFPIYLSNA